MNENAISFPKIASFLIVLVLAFYLIILGKPILAPLAFSILFALMLVPLVDYLQRRLQSVIGAILISFLLVLIPLAAIIFLFMLRLTNVFTYMPNMMGDMQVKLNNLIGWINQTLGGYVTIDKDWLVKNLLELADQPMALIGTGLQSTTSILTGTVLVFIFTFFLLMYRKAYKHFLIIQFEKPNQSEVKKFIQHVKELIQKYLYGTGAVILTLGTLNSIGLWLIGIEYAVTWGFFAALLAIIPYVGAFLGGFLPFVFAVFTTGTFWQPLAVILYYIFIQIIEGNFLTPKIVGSSIELNPLVAICSILLGNMVWGISGMILALPAIAIFKAVCSHVQVLKPLGVLLSSDIYAKRKTIRERFDNSRHRMGQLFRKSG